MDKKDLSEITEIMKKLEGLSNFIFKKVFNFKSRHKYETNFIKSLNFENLFNTYHIDDSIKRLSILLNKNKNSFKKLKKMYYPELKKELNEIDYYLLRLESELFDYDNENLKTLHSRKHTGVICEDSIKITVSHFKISVVTIKIILMELFGDIFNEIDSYNISNHTMIHFALVESFRNRKSSEHISAEFINSQIRNDFDGKFRVISTSQYSKFIGEHLGDLINNYGEFIEVKNKEIKCKNHLNNNKCLGKKTKDCFLQMDKSWDRFIGRDFKCNFRGQKNTLIISCFINFCPNEEYYQFQFIKWNYKKRFKIKSFKWVKS